MCVYDYLSGKSRELIFNVYQSKITQNEGYKGRVADIPIMALDYVFHMKVTLVFEDNGHYKT